MPAVTTSPRELTVMRREEGLESVWSYEQSDRTPGAFRAISVNELLRTPPSIHLYEWKNHNQAATSTDNQNGKPKYAAISHVWRSSPAVEELCRTLNRPLKIKISDGEHEISWHGLRQAACAAQDLHCEYLWLDLLCIDQIRRPKDGESDDREKSIQVKNMGRIYERADAVLVMVGGVGGVQSINQPSSWIDRAWTLQEASLCDNTFALVEWPTEYPETVFAPPIFRDKATEIDITKFQVPFERVSREPSIARVHLKKLICLELIGVDFVPNDFSVKCFESSLATAEADNLRLNAGRLALLQVLEEKNTPMRQCGAWRSMMLRISERPQDMVYSMMHLLDVDLSVDYSRSLEDLYAEVIEKVAIKGLPAWLGVGGSNGDAIPRHLSIRHQPRLANLAGLYPQLPTYNGRLLPRFEVQQRFLPVAQFVSRLADYISHFDIQFHLAHPWPHICCQMNQFKSRDLPYIQQFAGDVDNYHTTFLTVAGATGICCYKGNLGTDLIVIGQADWIESFAPPVREPSHNSWYVNFVEEREGAWTRVGAGMYSILDGTIPGNRTHITVGSRSEDIPRRRECNCGKLTAEKLTPDLQEVGDSGASDPESAAKESLEREFRNEIPYSETSKTDTKAAHQKTDPKITEVSNIPQDSKHGNQSPWFLLVICFLLFLYILFK
jgi:hypothetical protein